jgi:hypothetical protein
MIESKCDSVFTAISRLQFSHGFGQACRNSLLLLSIHLGLISVNFGSMKKIHITQGQGIEVMTTLSSVNIRNRSAKQNLIIFSPDLGKKG